MLDGGAVIVLSAAVLCAAELSAAVLSAAVLAAAVLAAAVSSLSDAESVFEASANVVPLAPPSLVGSSEPLAVSDESGGRSLPSFWASIGEARSRVDARIRLLEICIAPCQRNRLDVRMMHCDVRNV